jgi:hypothetical protein
MDSCIVPLDILKEIIRYDPLRWLAVSKRTNEHAYKMIDQQTIDEVLLFAIKKELDSLAWRCVVRRRLDNDVVLTKSILISQTTVKSLKNRLCQYNFQYNAIEYLTLYVGTSLF